MPKRLVVSCAVLAAGALAAAPALAGEPGQRDERSAYLLVIPTECEAYSPVPDDTHEVMFWYRRLSLAACLQPTTLARITEGSNLDAIVYDLTVELAAPMLLYRDALERGPSWVRLRAAYHVGLSTVSLVVRLRASVVASSNVALRARLERRLAQHLRIAQLALATVGVIALGEPWLATDPVARGMINSAQQLLDLLGGRPQIPVAPDRPHLARH